MVMIFHGDWIICGRGISLALHIHILLFSCFNCTTAQLGDEFLRVAMHDRCNEDDPACGLIQGCCCKPSHSFGFKISLQNQTEHPNSSVEVLCVDAEKFPVALPEKTETLKFLESNTLDLSLEKFDSSQLPKLTTIYIWKLKRLEILRNHSFRGFDALRTILLEDLPRLRVIEPLAFYRLRNLHELKIKHVGLISVPAFMGLSSAFTPLKVVLEGTEISEISPQSFKSLPARIKILQITWNERLSVVQDHAFNGSSIEQLVLSYNKNLTKISDRTFFGLNKLIKLSVRGTSISFLPTEDLKKLVEIDARQVPNLHRFPAAEELPSLRIADLTYSYHCCSLSAYGFGSVFEQNLNSKDRKLFPCNGNITYELSTERASTAAEYNDLDYYSQYDQGYDIDWSNLSIPSNVHPVLTHAELINEYHESSDPDADDSSKSFINKIYGRESGDGSWEDDHYGSYSADGIGGWRDTGSVAEVDTTKVAPSWELCYIDEQGKVVRDVYRTPVRCTPEPDAFNPCENVLGSNFLPAISWIVAALAIFGNFFVIFVLSVVTCDRACARQHQHHLSVQKFLVLNLAVADMCMGIYLLMISAMDARSSGEYYKYGVEWQTGIGCRISGFLSIFSSQLSVYTLSVISLERWYAIRFAIQLEKRMTMTCARACIFCGWLVAGLLAMLPLIGINNYEKTSICLPFDVSNVAGMAYVGVLLFIAIGAFVVDVICYLWMYTNVRTVGITEGRKRRGSASSSKTGVFHGMTATADAVVAKRMAILVFTNFACFFPISFFALTAAAGYPLISISQSKILLVIFYPINSCCNPFLYAILTKSFRRDLLAWFTSRGHCVQFAAKLNGAHWRRNSMDKGSMDRRETGVRKRLQRCVKYVSRRKSSNQDAGVQGCGSYRETNSGHRKGSKIRLLNLYPRGRIRNSDRRVQDMDNRSTSVSSCNSALDGRGRRSVADYFKMALGKKSHRGPRGTENNTKHERNVFPDVRWFKPNQPGCDIVTSTDGIISGRPIPDDSSPLMDCRNECEFTSHANDTKHNNFQQGRRASKSRHSTTTIETRLTLNGNHRGSDEQHPITHDPYS